MSATKIITHAARAVARLPSQFAGKTKLAALITDLVTPASGVEDALWELYTLRSIDTSTGNALDVIGRVVGQPRNGGTDSEYRPFLRAKVAANKSHGRVEDLINVIKLGVNDSDATHEVTWSNAEICHAKVRVNGVPVTEADAVAFVSILKKSVSAGVRVTLETSVEEPEDTFQFVEAVGTLDGGNSAGDIEFDVVSYDGTWPVFGRALIGAGSPVEETITYDNSGEAPPDSPGVGGGMFAVVNELGQPGLRFTHAGDAEVTLIPNTYTVDSRTAVTWENLEGGATASGNNLTGAVSWVAGGTSVETIAAGADGAVEFEKNTAAHNIICGLSVGNTNGGFADVDYAMQCQTSVNVIIREGGTIIYTHDKALGVSDVARVQRVGTEITFWINSAKIYTSTTASTGALLVDCSTNTALAEINNVFVEQHTAIATGPQGFVGKRYKVEWENIVNCDTEVNDLTKNDATAWDTAGATSIQKSSGDCAVEFTVGGADVLYGGLSEAFTATTRADIEYAIVLTSIPSVRVYENNVVKFTGTLDAPVAGDTCRVQRIGTEITYWFKGEKFYTSAVVDSGNALYFQTVINGNADKIVNAIFEATGDADSEPDQAGGALSAARSGG